MARRRKESLDVFAIGYCPKCKEDDALSIYVYRFRDHYDFVIECSSCDWIDDADKVMYEPAVGVGVTVCLPGKRLQLRDVNASPNNSQVQ